MTTLDNITVDNLKCGGCENTIKKTLQKIRGVEKVTIHPENNQIDVTHDEIVTRNMITHALKSMGYPEAGTTEGFGAMVSNAKSYISCAIGRMSSDADEEQPVSTETH
jgi:copper chaperone